MDMCIFCKVKKIKPSDLSDHFITKEHLDKARYNTEQCELVKKLQKFVYHKFATTFVINCAGGCGKTRTVISSIYNQKIICLFPTNSAKKAMTKQAKDLGIDIRQIKFSTLASFFKYTTDVDENDKSITFYSEPDIKKNVDKYIFIIDEASMCGGIYFHLIKHFLLNKTKVIILGDSAQLPTVITDNIIYTDFKFNDLEIKEEKEILTKNYYGYKFKSEEICPLFNLETEYKAELTRIMRTENIPLTKINEELRRNVLSNNLRLNTSLIKLYKDMNNSGIEIINKELQSVKFKVNKRENHCEVFQDEILLESINQKNSKIICFNANLVDEINSICKKLKNPDTFNKFDKDDKIICTSAIFKNDEEGRSIYICSGDEFIVENVNIIEKNLPRLINFNKENSTENNPDKIIEITTLEDKDYKIKLYELTLLCEKTKYCKEEKTFINEYVEEEFYVPFNEFEDTKINNWSKKYYDLVKKKKDKELKIKFFQHKRNLLKSNFRNYFKLNFCVNAHKCQGLTYDEVFVLVDNLKKIPDRNVYKKLIYTSLSRAKNRIVMNCMI